MTAITLTGLTKRFGATTAVDSIDLRIESGELFFLLGPSGCGKTTLLRMIAGFVEPTAGSIRFGDRDVTMLPPNRRNAGMVFQSYALWPHMTVEDNVGYGLRVRRTPAAERKKKVQEALRVVHMQDYAERKPNQLSGGQQQRAALARALVIQPTVLLLDEPLSNLDAKLRLEMRAEIRRICSETRITTVYVTHDQKEALSMADNMAVLRAGRIAQVGPPRQLYERPQSRFVADFLGETNFLPAVILERQQRTLVLETAAGRLHSHSPDDHAPDAGNVTISIRPEALQIRDQVPFASNAAEAPIPPNVIRTKLVDTTYLGDMAQLHVALADGHILRVNEFNPLTHRNCGDVIQLQVDAASITILAD